MKKTTDFLKKRWLIVFLAVIAVGLLILQVVTYRKKVGLPTPEPTATPDTLKPLPQPQSRFAQILGEGPTNQVLLSSSMFAKIPKNLPVYQTKKFTQEEIIEVYEKTIAGLGFSGKPKKAERMGEQYLAWQKEKNYLDINLSSGQFSFSGQLPLASPTPSQPLTSPEVQNLIRKNLASWNLISEEAKISQIEGFGVAGMELIPVENLNQAIVFQIVFNPEFEGYPLVGVGPAKNLIEAKIDNQGTLSSLFFNLHQVEKETLGDYPTQSFEELTQQLQQGEVQIIEVTSEGQPRSIPPLEDIEKVLILNLKVVYYETAETQEFYQPVFLLQGRITLKDEKTYQAIFLSPAIASEYFQ